MTDLLLELLSEEIPARMQRPAAQRLAEECRNRLAAAGLEVAQEAVKAYVTPRRLALWVKDLPEQIDGVREERRGPRIGAPEQALQGFLRSTGLGREKLTERDGYYFAEWKTDRQETAALLKPLIETMLAEFSWPKSMRWGDGEARWVRPLRSMVCLFGSEVLPVEFAGLTAGNVTSGHRFLAPGEITVNAPEQYASLLTEKGQVIPDYEQRKTNILQALNKKAEEAGLVLNIRPDDPLLDEVTGLVECPVVLMGGFDAAFLELPPEVLETSMRTHQKYFTLSRPDGALAAHFLTVSNSLKVGKEDRDAAGRITAGNERVLRARLSDARFFWEQDLKHPLEENTEKLKKVVFHERLGTVYEKTQRLVALAGWLADQCGGVTREEAERAALLSKADLVSEMVGEFPELQGVMGGYYAQAQGESEAVAGAIRRHYAPQGPEDAVPEERLAALVALADKLDTLAGLFSIGELPTGSKDPYALRRAVLGVIRIILGHGLRLPLKVVFSEAVWSVGVDHEEHGEAMAGRDKVVAQLLDFTAERMKVALKSEGLRHDRIRAVFAIGEDDLVRLVKRVEALDGFLETEDGANLLAAFRRAQRIVALESEEDGADYAAERVEKGALAQEEERALFAALEAVSPEVAGAIEHERYTDAMAALAGLRAPVDAFFDHVTVNAEDPSLRANRLRLLAHITARLGEVADFSVLEKS